MIRGQQERSGSLFSYVSIEERIPASHPLRRIRKLADQALDRLNPSFCQLYASEGRSSVPPEQLLLASLLQAFYGIRPKRLLLEQLNVGRLIFARAPTDLGGRDTSPSVSRRSTTRVEMAVHRVWGAALAHSLARFTSVAPLQPCHSSTFRPLIPC